MKKNLLTVAVGSALMLTTTTLLAVPFNSFDPRSMAMGGAGVAVANPATAPFFNPALLSIADTKDDFAIELPILGVRVSDPEDFIDAIDNFDDSLVTNLDNAITSFNAQIGLQRSTADISTAVTALNLEVQSLSGKPVQFELGGGMVIGIPSESFGMAFSVSGSVNFSGEFDYADAVTVTTLNQDLSKLDNCYGTIDPVANSAGFINCLKTANFSSFVVDFDTTNPSINFTASSETGNPSDIQSKARFIGVAMAEAGLSFSREMSMFGTEVAVGITPKVVAVTVSALSAFAS